MARAQGTRTTRRTQLLRVAAFWIPAQLINFKYTPVRHQLNFVLVVSLVWTTFLSLAFPPEPVGQKAHPAPPADADAAKPPEKKS